MDIQMLSSLRSHGFSASVQVDLRPVVPGAMPTTPIC